MLIVTEETQNFPANTCGDVKRYIRYDMRAWPADRVNFTIHMRFKSHLHDSSELYFVSLVGRGNMEVRVEGKCACGVTATA